MIGRFDRTVWVAQLVAFLVLGVAGRACAQIPDVRIKLDATGSYRIDPRGLPVQRYYSFFGRYSTASLSFTLEPGFNGYLSQKLEKIPNDGDTDSVEEVYIEDPGIWRIGKQYIPFGAGKLLRETAMGARADTNLILEDLPVSLSILDTGTGRQRGFVARLGGPDLGFSVAAGRNFGIDATSLTNIRLPSEASGVGRGHRQVLGFDISRSTPSSRFCFEAAAFRDGETLHDRDLTLFDVSAELFLNAPVHLTLGYTREAESRLSVWRAVGNLEASKNVALEPFLRFRNARLWDLGIQVRFRL